MHRKAPNVERRIMKVATIRWGFPQGHADESLNEAKAPRIPKGPWPNQLFYHRL
jgi:hypothetical protein